MIDSSGDMIDSKGDVTDGDSGDGTRADTADAGGGAAGFDLDRAWDLHPRVSVRPEPFGALLYHFGTRRLSFLKDRPLLDVVQALRGQPSARSACAAAGIDDAAATGRYAKALAVLARTEMLVAREPTPAHAEQQQAAQEEA